MSLSDNYPDIRSVWMNDYANAGVIDPRCSFARSDSTPSNVHYWSDEDHLSSENLLLQSQNFGTTWNNSPTVGSGAASSGTGPDGSDSWLMTAATSGSAAPSFNQDFSFKASTQYTYSVYVKAGTATHAWVAARGDASNSVTGTLNFSSPGSLATTTDNWTVNSSSVTAHGDWYRIVLTFTTNSNLTVPRVYVGLSDGAVPATYYPAMTPNGETIYVWGAQLEERGSATVYNATTTQIHREYAATLKSVAYSGQPRFEYEPTGDRSARGLLIEGQSSNLITRSHELDNTASWQPYGTCNVDASVAVGPDGTLTADLIRPTTATSAHDVQTVGGLTTVDTSTYTFSAYVKSAGLTKLRLMFVRGTSPYTTAALSLFTLTGDGSVTSYTGSGSISAVGNGWFRISATGQAIGTVTTAVIQLNDDSANNTFAGDGYSGIICTGVQFELGSFASSLISTSGSASTRTRDQLSIDDSSLFSGNEGTVVFEGQTLSGSTGFGRFWSISDGTNDNRIHVYPTSSTVVRFRVYRNGTEERNVATTVTDVTDNNRYAFTYEDNKLRLAQNGSLLRDDSNSAVMPVVNKLSIGMNPSGSGNQMNGYVKRIAFYNESLTDTELQSLTS